MQCLTSVRNVVLDPWKYRVALLGVGLMTIPFSHAADWRINTQQAKISFKTTGMMSVEGIIPKFESTVQGDLFSPENLQIDVTIYADQVSTGKSVSDDILKGSSFFNVKKYPFATFSSRNIRFLDQQHSMVLGNLTLAGITKTVEFKVNLGKPQIDENTQTIIVNTSADIPINRKDWGMTGFSALVAPVVVIHIDIPFISTAKK